MQIGRRSFLVGSAASVWAVSRGALADDEAMASFEASLESSMQAAHTPGMMVAAINEGRVVYSRAFGLADVASARAMTVDSVMNIASISKTVTATAVMQLAEAGSISLDDDVAALVGFPIRNPNHPKDAITPYRLLTHTSSLRDGPAYDDGYACGDPAVSLGDWLERYLKVGGDLYDERRNFLSRAPGTTHVYSNTGFALLGLVVERVSGMGFRAYCGRHIFEPLGMTATGWFLEDIDREDHATPHAFVDEDAGAREPLIASGPVGGFAPYCLYSFPTYPDGLLRTSASDYAKFLMACLRIGAGGTGGVLAAETLRSMLKDHEDTRTADRLEAVQGLCWVGSRDGRGRERWSHSGADPGVRTLAMMDVDSGAAALAFANGPAGEYLYEAVERLLDHARTVA